MGDIEGEKKMVISIIKSIIVSVKGGLLFHRLDGDYREQNGQRIPYSKFGFPNLEEFIRSISEVKVSRVDGNTMLSVVDPKMAHIKSLLDRQKPPKKRKMPKRGFAPRSNYGRAAVRPSPRGGFAPRPGGLSYRPAPPPTRRPMEPPRAPPNGRRPMEPPRAPPNGRRPMEPPRGPPNGSYRGQDRGHSDCPPSTNYFSRRPSVTDHDVNKNRAVFQPEQIKAYSNTHSIRQGQGFVEYIPLVDNPPPPSTRQEQDNPRSVRQQHDYIPSDNLTSKSASPTETVENKGSEDKRESSVLTKKYSDFVRRLNEEQAAKRLAASSKSEGGTNNGNGPPLVRGRGTRKPVEDLRSRLSNVSVSAQNGVGRQSSQIVRDAPADLRSRLSNVSVSAQNGVGRQSSQVIREVPASRDQTAPRPMAREVPASAAGSPAKQSMSARFSSANHREYVTQNRVGDGMNALTVTIANDFVPDCDDDDEDWVDYDEDEQDEESCAAYQKLLLRPKFRNHQLIGDDFLLHFANFIDEPCQLSKGGQLSECGLCISGQTVTMCLNEIHETKIISDRVILLVGAVDLMQGMDFSTLKLRLISLLTELMDKDIKRVYICTLPPLVHLSRGSGYVRKLFNNYIKSMQSDTMRVIDLDTEPFLDQDKQMCASYFEENDIQTVNPYSTPVYMRMWNNRGLEEMRNMIQKCLG